MGAQDGCDVAVGNQGGELGSAAVELVGGPRGRASGVAEVDLFVPKLQAQVVGQQVYTARYTSVGRRNRLQVTAPVAAGGVSASWLW